MSKDGSSTNVTGRLALATTPQAVLRTYEGIAYGFTNQNLAQYFQGLLAAAPTQADLVSTGREAGWLRKSWSGRGMNATWQLLRTVSGCRTYPKESLEG